jgi:uncharacterized protein
MLTSDLLKTRIKGKTIQPSLVTETGKTLQMAKGILLVVDEHVGKSRGELVEALQEISSIEVNHKLCKGLAKIASDQCEFVAPAVEVNGNLDAKSLRRYVFEEAAKIGPVSLEDNLPGKVTATQVLEKISPDLEVTPDKIMEFLYADLKEMEILYNGPKNQTPLGLIRRYNLALCQSLLLHASSITLTLFSPDAKWLRLIFRRLKFYRLMFRVYYFNDRIEIILDGPQSLLKQSSRYGFQFALFLPVLPLLNTRWGLAAEILWGKKRKVRKSFTLDSTSPLHSHYTARGTWKSNTEEWFEERFLAKDRGWTLTEGDVLDLGEQQILIPNYKFTKDETEVYLDIIGFWRKSYLQTVISLAPENIIFAVSKKYSAEAKSLPKELQKKIMIFSEVIPISHIIDALAIVEKSTKNNREIN